MEIQVLISDWISSLADLLPVGYAFGAGMVSAVNPCGFFMLPVYLTLYLGAEEGNYQDTSIWHRMGKALWVTVMVVAGFGLLFGVVGGIVSAGGYFLMGLVPWLAVVIGILLIALGLWVLAGKSLSVPGITSLVEKTGDLRQMSTGGFFIFGLVFGATSLGCTLPIFLAVVGSSITAGNLFKGFMQFVSYILGMGLVLLILTLGIALVKKRLVLGTMRRVVPYVQKLSALFLLTAGIYLIYYWYSSGLLFNG